MKILMLNIQYYPNIEGGAEISTQKLAEGLVKTNDVSVLCDGAENQMPEVINGVKVYRTPVRIGYRCKIEEVLTRSYKIQAYKRIKKIIKEINPDVLHTNNLHAFTVIVWKIAKELGIPMVHTLRDYSLLDRRRFFENYIREKCSNYVDVVTAPSQFTLNVFLKAGMFKKNKKSIAVPNAIDYVENDLRECVCQKIVRIGGKIKFAYLGRYAPEKGVDWLVRVFSLIDKNEAELHLFGKGKLEDRTLQIIAEMSNIFDHGFCAESKLMGKLKQCDVVVAPSLWDEPFGRIILDAYKAACPVIITNRGGMPEVVEDSKTGLILKSENDSELQDAIEYFLDRDNIKKMIPNIANQLHRYGIEDQVSTFTELYQFAIMGEGRR